MRDWEDLVAEFLEEIRLRQKADSLRAWSDWLKRLVAFCREQSLACDSLGPWHVEAFQNVLVWTPTRDGRLYAPNTIYQAMRMVRAFLRWAAALGYLPSNPTRGLSLPEPPNRPVPSLSAQELARFFQAASRPDPRGWRDRALLETIMEAALPVGHLVALDLADLDLPGARLLVPGGREVALSSSLTQSLEQYLRFARPHWCDRDPEALFLSMKAQRIRSRTVLEVVRSTAYRSGLSWVTPRILACAGRARQEEFQRRRLTRESP